MENQSVFAENLNWHNYNESQTREKVLFVNILADLCSFIQEPIHDTGRKPSLVKDIVFSSVLKEYLNTSARRVQGELKLFSRAGLLTREIPFNTLLDNLEKLIVRDILKELIEISAMPLKQIESDFAIDSTGFSISRYETYFHYKHKRDVQWRSYRKCHAVCGVKTNVITSIDITGRDVNDSTEFEPLVKNTAKNFLIREVSADKGYLSKKNYNLVKDLGGDAFIPFKANTTRHNLTKDDYIFHKMFEVFKEHKDDFMNHYHKRSNIESTFSMIKRKFGNNVKSKKEVSQDNEILSKILANNICILVQEIFLNGINVDFYPHSSAYYARK